MFSLSRSLNRTLCAVIIGAATLTALAVGVTSYLLAREALETESQMRAKSLAEDRESWIVDLLEARWQQLEQLGSDPEIHRVLAGQAEARALNSELEVKRNLGHFGLLAVTDTSGTVVAASEPAEIGTGQSGQEWFRRALEKPAVGDLHRVGGTAVEVTLAVPVESRGRPIGVVLGHSRLDSVYEALTNYEALGESGESYLIDREGLLLSPSRFVEDAAFRVENRQGAYRQLTVEKEIGGGIWDNYLGEEVLGFVMFDDFREHGVDWALVSEIDTHEAFAGVERLRRSVVAVLAVIVALAVVAGLLVARSITRPVVVLSRSAEQISRGDLSVDLGATGRTDEIGALHRAFAEMTKSLRSLIGQIQTSAEDLTTSSSEIAGTAQQSAATAVEQASAVSEVSSTTEELHQTSSASVERARDVAESSENASKTGQRGLSAIAHSVDAMEALSERVGKIATQILELSEQNLQIGEIVETVNKLAEQSNLLAVNASIEAAKAGDQGKGFAVVAAEVRSLARESQEATQQIRTILADIQKATQRAVLTTEEGSKRMEEGRQAISTVQEVIEELAMVLEENAEKARQIVAAANQQAAGVGEITEAIGDVARAGQDTAAGAHQLEASAGSLSTLARQLLETVGHYRVEAPAT